MTVVADSNSPGRCGEFTVCRKWRFMTWNIDEQGMEDGRESSRAYDMDLGKTRLSPKGWASRHGFNGYSRYCCSQSTLSLIQS